MGILKVNPNQEHERRILPKKPKQNDPMPSASSEEVLFDSPTWDEELLRITGFQSDCPEPVIMEESMDEIWNIDVEVTNGNITPEDASIIAQNNFEFENLQAPQQPSAEIRSYGFEDVDDVWGPNSLVSPAVVEGINIEDSNDSIEDVDTIFNMDIVQCAIDETGLKSLKMEEEEAAVNPEIAENQPIFQIQANTEPFGSSANFIHPTPGNFVTVTVDNGTLSQILPSIEPVKEEENPLFVIPEVTTSKKKAGRPERQHPIKITEIPKHGSVELTPDQLKSLKYRRSRDLNNEASKRCRKNRKEKQEMKEQECDELAAQNLRLQEILSAKETELENLKMKLGALGYYY